MTEQMVKSLDPSLLKPASRRDLLDRERKEYLKTAEDIRKKPWSLDEGAAWLETYVKGDRICDAPNTPDFIFSKEDRNKLWLKPTPGSTT